MERGSVKFQTLGDFSAGVGMAVWALTLSFCCLGLAALLASRVEGLKKKRFNIDIRV